MNWIKGLGKQLTDTVKAKAGEAKQRLEEPELTADERALLERFNRVKAHIPADLLALLPPAPQGENLWNRQDIRRLLADPELEGALEVGEAFHAIHLEEEAARMAAEEKQRAEEALQARIEKAQARVRALAEIDAYYSNELNAIQLPLRRCKVALPGNSFRSFAGAVHDQYEGKQNRKETLQAKTLAGQLIGHVVDLSSQASDISAIMAGLEGTSLQRVLRDMPETERAILRLASTLHELEVMSEVEYVQTITPILWNNGSTLITTTDRYQNPHERPKLNDALRSMMSTAFGDVASSFARAQTSLRNALEPDSRLSAQDRAILEGLLYSGSRWMTAQQGKTALLGKDGLTDGALRLGMLGDGSDLMFNMRESLVTIAPPGAGKSQAHVIRNLLHLKAPAVVLDIKGESFASTGKWRSENVGPVHVIEPAAADRSAKFNPLDFIDTDPDSAWEQARNLADLMIIPAIKGDEYFEGRARDMITTALLDVALSEEGNLRTMASVLDRLYLSDNEQLGEWFDHLAGLGVPQLRRQASALKGMPEKQREGILDSARRQLEIWQSSAIEKITGSTTFRPDRLRAENATLYLCVNLEDVKKYASVLRVIIGQTFSTLCKGESETKALPVTFFLDELPRLGRMDVVESGLDVGRGYGVRLWMFCQNLGQLRTAYPNAAGMISNCAARCFMNPDEDGAKWMSENLGMRHGLLDGKRKPLAEPSQLTGPEFADQIVVFSRGNSPARLAKRPAHADPECRARMSG